MSPKNIDDNDMHIGATPIIFERAKNLRENMTPSEKEVWELVRNKNINGYKFRRQHPILKYILDFYCHKLKLVIEIDGGIHNTREQIKKDKLRTKHLEEYGLTILRFSNDEVKKNIDKVRDKIVEKIEELIKTTPKP